MKQLIAPSPRCTVEKEKERQEPSEGGSAPELQHDVTIHGTYLGKFSLPAGATLADLIEKIKEKEQVGDLDLTKFTVMLNDRQIELNPDGTLKENPALTESATLTLLKQFIGG